MYHGSCIFFFLLWILTAACRILVPGPGIESRPPELGAWSLSHWTTREVLVYAFLHFLFRPLLCRWSDVELTGVSGTHKAKSSFKSWPWRLRNRVHTQGTTQRAGCRLQVLRDPRKEKAPSGVWSKNAHWEKGLSWAPSMSRQGLSRWEQGKNIPEGRNRMSSGSEADVWKAFWATIG